MCVYMTYERLIPLSSVLLESSLTRTTAPVASGTLLFSLSSQSLCFSSSRRLIYGITRSMYWGISVVTLSLSLSVSLSSFLTWLFPSFFLSFSLAFFFPL